MNKNELITAVADNSGLSKKDAEKAINSFVNIVTNTLGSGEKVQLVGFGTFEVRDRKARKGHNPLTREPLEIAASKAPVFKAGKALKDSLNK